MNALGVVVADTTPLNYLIVIDRAEILAALFGEVLIPEAVVQELRHPKAPAAVSRRRRVFPPTTPATPSTHHPPTPPDGLARMLVRRN